MSDRELLLLAEEARQHSYSPYSHFSVGAALLCQDGSVYKGANIENASYGATNCAERTAFFKAVFDGKRDFSALAVVGGSVDRAEDFCFPCGICRQVMAEFCGPDFRLLFQNGSGRQKVCTLGELFPCGFGPEALSSTREDETT